MSHRISYANFPDPRVLGCPWAPVRSASRNRTRHPQASPGISSSDTLPCGLYPNSWVSSFLVMTLTILNPVRCPPQISATLVYFPSWDVPISSWKSQCPLLPDPRIFSGHYTLPCVPSCLCTLSWACLPALNLLYVCAGSHLVFPFYAVFRPCSALTPKFEEVSE